MAPSDKEKAAQRLQRLRQSDRGIKSIKQPTSKPTRMFRKDLDNYGEHYQLKFDVPFMHKLELQKIAIYRSSHCKWRFSINAIQGPEPYETREDASMAAIDAVRTIAASFSSITFQDLTPDLK
jgi:uncharacterized protein YegP (UPF0339 family)